MDRRSFLQGALAITGAASLPTLSRAVLAEQLNFDAPGDAGTQCIRPK